MGSSTSTTNPVHAAPQGRILWTRHRTVLPVVGGAGGPPVGGKGAPEAEVMQRSASGSGGKKSNQLQALGGGKSAVDSKASPAADAAVDQDGPDDNGAAEHTAMFTLWVSHLGLFAVAAKQQSLAHFPVASPRLPFCGSYPRHSSRAGVRRCLVRTPGNC